jgi:ribosomal protein S18 acetylase RimI-like enzyme
VGNLENKLYIRRLQEEDAGEVSELIRRNFMEVNIKDYSYQEMKKLYDIYNAEKVLQVASYAHSYVVEDSKQIVGCGSISSYWGKEDESILLSIFVLPEYQGMGIGKKIISTLEQDEYYIRAKRVEIPSSITACEFYRKFGYNYKDGVKALDDEGHYRLEKFR